MTEAGEEFYVDDDVVACDGGGGPLGHPLVYLPLGKDGWVECPYCSRRFVHRPDGHNGGDFMEESLDEAESGGNPPKT